MKKNFLLLFSLFVWAGLSAQTTVSFRLDPTSLPADAKGAIIGIRGGVPPLYWESTIPLQPIERGRIFEVTLSFPEIPSHKVLEYKFVYEKGESGKPVWEEVPTNRWVYCSSENVSTSNNRWAELPPVDWGKMPKIPSAKLKDDLKILQNVLTTLHPGLYRYNTPGQIDALFARYRKVFSVEMSHMDAYRHFSKLLGSIQCGHTFCSFFNQSDFIKNILFGQADRLPLAFDLLEKRMIVTAVAAPKTDQYPLRAGHEILSINEIPVSAILDTLLQVVKADGPMNNKRLNSLQSTGYDYPEPFDVYFPLFFPPKNGSYVVNSVDLATGENHTSTLPAIRTADRAALLTKQLGAQKGAPADLWAFELWDEGKTAYLRMGTFAVYDSDFDWAAFLKNAFAQIAEKKCTNFVIDIRNNEGGLDEVAYAVLAHLTSATLEDLPQTLRSQYRTVPENLRPYLRTWDNGFYDLGKAVKALPDSSGYVLAGGDKTVKVKPIKPIFTGKTYLLINAANSSATFYMARFAKFHKLATLVGETTGGSQRGLNGSRMFFCTLPNSGIELDVPLVGTFPVGENLPQGGIEPDIAVQRTQADILKGTDAILKAVKALTAQ